ncbi:MAG: cysteine dioxygenase [Bacteroidales bacterium]|jgi:hypothetical protein|nr:cysteine dioxygenase [Bacteroidales bacterium]
MKTERTIANDFPQPIEVQVGYDRFFNGIKEIVNGKKIDNALGEKLKTYVFDSFDSFDFSDFQEFSDTLYVRKYLGKDFETGWEAILMCWKKGNQTAIHGHPQFAAYNFVKGDFLVEVFEAKDDFVQLANAIEAKRGDGFFAVGEPDAFDNHIHRITCLSDVGYSLHIYSDDARKGFNMNELLKG